MIPFAVRAIQPDREDPFLEICMGNGARRIEFDSPITEIPPSRVADNREAACIGKENNEGRRTRRDVCSKIYTGCTFCRDSHTGEYQEKNQQNP